jgi:hypothetical protein
MRRGRKKEGRGSSEVAQREGVKRRNKKKRRRRRSNKRSLTFLACLRVEEQIRRKGSWLGMTIVSWGSRQSQRMS